MPTPPIFSRVAVNDPNLERAVLNALLNDHSLAVDEALQLLTEKCFYQPLHLTIYHAIMHLYSQGTGLSLLSLSDHLIGTMPPDRVNELLFQLTQIDMEQLNAMGLLTMTRRLVEYSQRRTLLLVADTLYQLATDMTRPFEEGMAEVQRLIDQTMTGPADSYVTLHQRIDEELQIVEDNLSDATRHTGLLTGLPDIDQRGGLPDDGLTILVAKSGHGKTSFADYLALHAMKEGRHVAFYSMEMSQHKVTARMLAMESQVNAMAIQRFRLCDADYQRVHQAADRLKQAHANAFWFDNRRCRSIDQIVMSARALNKSQGLDMIVVDFLQMMRSAEKQNPENVNKLMADIARQLHDIALELHIAVIALSQVNRTVQVASMAAIRDSGEIAEAADMVLVLRRPYVDQQPYNAPHANIDTRHTMQVACEKSRDGERFEFFVGFDEQYTRVYAIDQQHLPQEGYTPTGPATPSEPSLFGI